MSQQAKYSSLIPLKCDLNRCALCRDRCPARSIQAAAARALVRLPARECPRMSRRVVASVWKMSSPRVKKSRSKSANRDSIAPDNDSKNSRHNNIMMQKKNPLIQRLELFNRQSTNGLVADVQCFCIHEEKTYTYAKEIEQEKKKKKKLYFDLRSSCSVSWGVACALWNIDLPRFPCGPSTTLLVTSGVFLFISLMSFFFFFFLRWNRFDPTGTRVCKHLSSHRRVETIVKRCV